MAGGYSTRRQLDRDRALIDRVASDGAGQAPELVGASPRACWIRWSDEATPGHVLHWHRDGNSWWALVLVTVPRSAVTPRSEDDAREVRDQG